jgi:hypothetical protein
VTRVDAERQLGRVDGLAKRLRGRTILAGVAVGSALVMIAPVVLAWLPEVWWDRPGSLVPLTLVVSLILAQSVLVVRARRATSALRVTDLAEETGRAIGLRDGQLSGALELAGSTGTGSMELAELQRARVAAALERVSDAQLLPARTAQARRRITLSLGSAATALLALWLTAGLRPAESRAAAGAIARPWVYAFPPPPPPMRIDVLDEPVLRGDPARLRIRATGRAVVSLHWQPEGEADRSAGIPVGEDGTAEGRTGPVRVNTLAWVEDESGRRSDTVRVNPADPLLAKELIVISRLPRWRGGAEDTVQTPIPPLTIESGTVIRVEGRANHPLSVAELVSETADTAVDLSVSGARFGGEFTPESDGVWRFDLRPRGQVPGLRLPAPLELTILHDSPPRVRVVRPGRDVEIAADPALQLVIDASDDVGLESLHLVTWKATASGIRSDPRSERLAESDGELRRVVRADLPLAPFALAPGDTLLYRVVARDGNPATGASTSRTWRVTVPSIAELRRTATERTGELAADAQVLADQVSELRRDAAEAAAGSSRAGAGESGRFEGTEAARAVEQQSRDVEQRMEELERDLAELQAGLDTSPAAEPALRRRLEELGDLMRELRESGLAERLRALEEALRQIDPAATRDALEQLSRSAADLERQVDEAADLMERVATEQALRDAATQVSDLAERQARAAASPEQEDAWAAEELELAEAADELSRRLAEVEERLEMQGADAASDSVSGADAAIRQASDRMREAADAARSQPGGPSAARGGGDRNAQRAAEQAAASLEEAARSMEDASESLGADWRGEAVEALDRAGRQSLDLAREQAALSEQMQAATGRRELAARQDAIARGLDEVLERLSEASRKTALVDRRVGPTASRARTRMEELSRALSESTGTPAAASAAGKELAEELNELAGRLHASRRAMEAAESGTGMDEALEQLASMSEAQAGLNRDAGGLMMLAGSGSPLPAGVEDIAARQQRIADQLEALSKEPGASELPGRPGLLAEEADEIAASLRDNGIDRRTIERQERLFRQLLDAGRTLEREPDPERRESTTAIARPVAGPGELPEGVLDGPRFPYPDERSLGELSPTERRLILDYFDRLNRVVSPRP